MTAEPEREFVFASPAWIDEARRILQDLVGRLGEEGRSFSVCERFTDAPVEVASDGTAAWHFRIDGRRVEVGSGALEDADVQIKADYQATLPAARLVYTPEIVAQRRAAGPRPGVQGDMAKAPPYLVELHNRLAVVTA